MNNPEIPQKSPYQVKLEPGQYYWCACGKSTNQPFCNGSHKGSEFIPVKFEIIEEKSAYLCGCKHTKNQPFCDGSHTKL